MLGRLCLQLARGFDERQQRQVHKDTVTAWLIVGKLTNGLKEGQAFDVPNSAADFAQHKINFIITNVDELFDLVGYMGDYLDCFAQIISAPFFFENS